jgi:hypothetical protein
MSLGRRVASAVVVIASLAAPGAAWAQTTDDYTGPPPVVSPTVVSPGGNANPPVVLGNTQTPRAGSDNLPFTGADIAQFTVIGLSALGAGYVLRRRSRRLA